MSNQDPIEANDFPLKNIWLIKVVFYGFACSFLATDIGLGAIEDVLNLNKCLKRNTKISSFLKILILKQNQTFLYVFI